MSLQEGTDGAVMLINNLCLITLRTATQQARAHQNSPLPQFAQYCAK